MTEQTREWITECSYWAQAQRRHRATGPEPRFKINGKQSNEQETQNNCKTAVQRNAKQPEKDVKWPHIE